MFLIRGHMENLEFVPQIHWVFGLSRNWNVLSVPASTTPWRSCWRRLTLQCRFLCEGLEPPQLELLSFSSLFLSYLEHTFFKTFITLGIIIGLYQAPRGQRLCPFYLCTL